jgi:uncharacterized protein
MKRLMLAATLALTFTTGRLIPAPSESPARAVGTGNVAWFDITTSGMAGSKEFYGKLFDWTFVPVAGTDQAIVIVAAGVEIGTIRTAEGKPSPFNGVVYIQVNDIVAACRRAKELGGTVIPGFPFNVPGGKGAIALLIDPAGHPFGMFSKTLLPPPPAK